MLGRLRAIAQTISYEVCFILYLMGFFIFFLDLGFINFIFFQNRLRFFFKFLFDINFNSYFFSRD